MLAGDLDGYGVSINLDGIYFGNIEFLPLFALIYCMQAGVCVPAGSLAFKIGPHYLELITCIIKKVIRLAWFIAKGLENALLPFKN